MTYDPYKIYPYLTVEEMRKNPRLIEELSPEGRAGSRFSGSTEPNLALKYFSKEDQILECGPVFGQFTKLLQDEGYTNVHALDFVNMLHFPDQAKLTFHEIDFNAEKIPYCDGSFDGATAWGIIEHMENPFHFVRELHRVLKPGGVLLFSLPNVLHAASRLGFLRRGVFPRWNEKSNHIFILPPGVFEKTVLRYFDLEETRYTKPGTITMRRPKSALRLFFDQLSTKIFPANVWFGNYVLYILKRKAER